MRLKLGVTALTAAAVLVLSACGSGGSDADHGMGQTAPDATAGAPAAPPMQSDQPTGSAPAMTMGMGSPEASSMPTADVDTPPISEVFNDADVTFATDMISHHMQAIEMAELAPSRSTDDQVLALAAQIAAAQQPEITQMLAYLDVWGAPAPTHEMGHMNGMMSDEDMTSLDALTGEEFDRMWLTLMTEHHQGAIDMSTTELADGSNPNAKTLAQSIITAQQAEITTMAELLN